MRVVLIGGSFESKLSLDYVADEISRQIGAEVTSYTFSFALHNRKAISEAVRGNLLITHSSGVMLIGGSAKPKKAVLISPTQPVPPRILFLRAAKKTFTHSLEFMQAKNRRRVARILLSNALELFTHPYHNLKPVISGEISAFDLRDYMPRPYPVRVLISKNDEMFTRNENRLESSEGLEVMRLDAMHDEIFIDTRKIINEALKR